MNIIKPEKSKLFNVFDTGNIFQQQNSYNILSVCESTGFVLHICQHYILSNVCVNDKVCKYPTGKKSSVITKNLLNFSHMWQKWVVVRSHSRLTTVLQWWWSVVLPKERKLNQNILGLSTILMHTHTILMAFNAFPHRCLLDRYGLCFNSKLLTKKNETLGEWNGEQVGEWQRSTGMATTNEVT